MKKVLIAGLGSIGQRHSRCLKEIYGDAVELHAFRSRGLNHIINDNMTTVKDTSPIKHYGIIEHSDLDEALSHKMDAVFVTNPPDLHIPTALTAVKAGVNVFIEKPISGNNFDGLGELVIETEKKGVVCMVGHQLRYHAITKRIKEIIDKELLGILTSSELFFAEYLPGMHPYEDYRTSHAAWEERGGGTILSLNHDIDIACYLLGLPNRLFCMGGKLSSLEMNTEDTAHILMNISREGKNMNVHLWLDFVQRPTRRFWMITGDNGSLHADLVNNVLKVDTYNSGKHETIEEDFSSFQRNNMYIDEIKDFFNAIENKTPSPLGLEEAYAIHKVSFAAKKSLESGNPVNFN